MKKVKNGYSKSLSPLLNSRELGKFGSPLAGSAGLIPTTCKEVFRLPMLLPPGSPPVSEALWMGSLVLGLLLLTVLTYRLWKCCQPARGRQGPPAPLKWPTFPSTPL